MTLVDKLVEEATAEIKNNFAFVSPKTLEMIIGDVDHYIRYAVEKTADAMELQKTDKLWQCDHFDGSYHLVNYREHKNKDGMSECDLNGLSSAGYPVDEGYNQAVAELEEKRKGLGI